MRGAVEAREKLKLQLIWMNWMEEDGDNFQLRPGNCSALKTSDLLFLFLFLTLISDSASTSASTSTSSFTSIWSYQWISLKALRDSKSEAQEGVWTVCSLSSSKPKDLLMATQQQVATTYLHTYIVKSRNQSRPWDYVAQCNTCCRKCVPSSQWTWDW